MLLDALEHFCFEQYAEDILNSFERWRRKEPLPDSAPNKVSVQIINLNMSRAILASQNLAPMHLSLRFSRHVLSPLKQPCEVMCVWDCSSSRKFGGVGGASYQVLQKIVELELCCEPLEDIWMSHFVYYLDLQYFLKLFKFIL